MCSLHLRPSAPSLAMPDYLIESESDCSQGKMTTSMSVTCEQNQQIHEIEISFLCDLEEPKNVAVRMPTEWDWIGHFILLTLGLKL